MKPNQRQESILVLLRICTVLLAATSFWATKRGMAEYTFPKGWQATAASLGIQGLLLGLNFSLPSLLKQCRKFQKLSLLALTVVVLFCSSWFSYLYIAGQAYGLSWDAYSRLLAQSTYREELFAAETYTDQYAEAMTAALADQVTALYQQAVAMDTDTIDVSQNINWDAERDNYAEGDVVVSNSMRTVIDAMESAMADNASQDVRDNAATILSNMQTSFQTNIDSLSDRIETNRQETTNASTAMQNAQIQRDSAPDNADIIEAYNRAASNYNKLLENRASLMEQQGSYQNALQRMSYYAVVLGLSEEGVSSYFIGENLRQIQSEIFGASPDSEKMLSLATEIFNRLQSAIDFGDEQGGNSDYLQLLTNMNRFVQNLNQYQAIKDSNKALQEQIDGLANGSILPLNAELQNDHTETVSSEQNIESQNSDTQIDDDKQITEGFTWQEVWSEQFNILKSKISALPIYTLTDDNTSFDLEMFDRAASANRLDETMRRYLTSHNAAQQGLIYLMSPYRDMAIFALILAFLLDIAAFIIGVIIDRTSNSKLQNIGDEITEQKLAPDMNHGIMWSLVPTLNRYVFLTGDYMYVNGEMVYKAIVNGKATEVKDLNKDLKAGLYLKSNGEVLPMQSTELLFKGADHGPQDGVYSDCIIHYEDELVTILQNESRRFVGAASPYTPVYQFSNGICHILFAKDLSNVSGDQIVIALNKDGTRIAEIYVIL